MKQQGFNISEIFRRMAKSQYTWMAIAVLVAALLIWGCLVWTCQTVRQTEVAVEVDQQINITPQQIESIKAIGEWEFLAIADEELVDTVRKGFFTDDHLVRIYYGTVRLGINLHQAPAGWLKTEGDSITATLPRIGLSSRDFIDEAKTKSFHETGRRTAADREHLYKKAYRQMLSHCMTKENMEQARENGEMQFRRMMQTLGFERVGIVWE
jgi:hypothetical protein